MTDFRQIATDALTRSESIVAGLLPDGKRSGQEWIARNPTRADATAGSFSVNLQTGRWADFASGDKGGDLISLVAFVRGTTQGEAALEITGHRQTARNGSPVKSIMHPTRGKPSQTWSYHDRTGNPVGYACRFEESNGGKVVLPFSFIENRWQWKAMPEPRPLYRLPDLLKHSKKPVLVVEGEKAADAAQKLFPEATVTTWSGGSKAAAKTDWTPLQGRNLLLWPDADEPGVEAMQQVKAALLKLPSARVYLPALPDGLPKGFDAADIAPLGLGQDFALQLFQGTTPDGLCPLCWANKVAASIGSCTHRAGLDAARKNISSTHPNP